MPRRKSTDRPPAVADEYGAALAEHREYERAVRRYLEWLDSAHTRGSRGKDPSAERARLAQVEQQLATAPPLKRLQLAQERLELHRAIAASAVDPGDPDELEADFIRVAAAYGQRKGIGYQAWRAVGVPPRVLKAAGITRR